MTVPVSAMLTIDSIPAEFVKKFPEDASTHCVLAAYLTHGDNDDGYDDSKAKLDLWRMVWPSWQDFKDTVPMLWPEYLEPSSSMSREHSTAKGPTLPPSASGVWHSISPTSQDIEYGAIYQNILSQQQDRFRAAWEEVISVFPNTEWEPFAYNWFIINTRSFYYVTPGKDPPEDWNDAVGMVPVADYFNHTGEPVSSKKYKCGLLIWKAWMLTKPESHARLLLTTHNTLSGRIGALVIDSSSDVENDGVANVLSQRRAKKYISAMGHIQMIFSWLNVSLKNAHDD